MQVKFKTRVAVLLAGSAMAFATGGAAQARALFDTGIVATTAAPSDFAPVILLADNEDAGTIGITGDVSPDDSAPDEGTATDDTKPDDQDVAGTDECADCGGGSVDGGTVEDGSVDADIDFSGGCIDCNVAFDGDAQPLGGGFEVTSVGGPEVQRGGDLGQSGVGSRGNDSRDLCETASVGYKSGSCR